MPKLKRLSFKQKEFCKSFIEKRGNATEAALSSYNCGSRNMATVIGTTNLDKPMIRNELERLMEQKSITDSLMMDKLKEGMEANVVPTFQGVATESDIADHDKRFKWWDAAAKIRGLYPAQETINKNLNLDVYLENMPAKQFKGLLRSLLLPAKNEDNKKVIVQKEND